MLAEVNKKKNSLRKILFLPGMGFGDTQEWWAEKACRIRPHEGVDIGCYEDFRGNRHFFTEGTKIPALFSGEIVSVCDDFLGKTLFIETHDSRDDVLIMAYAHIASHLTCGIEVDRADVLGVIAPGSDRVHAHLHVSLLILPQDFKKNNLNWNFLNTYQVNVFRDPFIT